MLLLSSANYFCPVLFFSQNILTRTRLRICIGWYRFASVGSDLDPKYSHMLTAANKVGKRANIRNQYNQEPRLTQDTIRKVTTSQLDITNESQEVSPFPAGDKKASINRRA